MTDERFTACWARLRELWPAFPNQNDKVIKSVYYRRLNKFKSDAVEKAIGLCLDSCKRFPTIAQIIEQLPSGAYEEVTGGSMDTMNEQIRRRQDADKCIYTVTWIANATGDITGYKLERTGKDADEPAQEVRDSETPGDRGSGDAAGGGTLESDV